MNLATSLSADLQDRILCTLDSVHDLACLVKASRATPLAETFAARESSIIDSVFQNQFDDAYHPARMLIRLESISPEDYAKLKESLEEGDFISKNLVWNDLVVIHRLHRKLLGASEAYVHLIGGSDGRLEDTWPEFRLALLVYGIYCKLRMFKENFILPNIEDVTLLMAMLAVHDFFCQVIKYYHPDMHSRYTSVDPGVRGQILSQGPWVLMDIYNGDIDNCKCIKCAPENNSSTKLANFKGFFMSDFRKAMRSKGYDPTKINDELVHLVILQDDDPELLEDYLAKRYN